MESCERAPHDPASIDAAGFSRFDTLVYSPLRAQSPEVAADLESARAVFERLASVPLKQAIVLSSAAVYSANHQHTGLLRESAFIGGTRNGIADDWREVERLSEMIGQRSGAAPTTRTIVRPAAVLDGSDYFSRLLLGKVAVTFPGHDPTIQFLSPHDLAEALAKLIELRLAGTYNVAPTAGIPLKQAIALAGGIRMPIARKAQTVARAVTSQAGLGASAEQTEYIQYSWTVSGDKLERDTGFAATRSSAGAIVELKGGDPHGPGVPAFDDFGMDAAYIRRYCGHLFKFLHDYYWRVEIDGIEEVPLQGRGVLVGMHRGFMPFDGVMALFALVTKRNRIPRFLIHPSLIEVPLPRRLHGQAGRHHGLPGERRLRARARRTARRVPRGHPRRVHDVQARLHARQVRARRVRAHGAAQPRADPAVCHRRQRRDLSRSSSAWTGSGSSATRSGRSCRSRRLPFPLPSKWHTRFLPRDARSRSSTGPRPPTTPAGAPDQPRGPAADAGGDRRDAAAAHVDLQRIDLRAVGEARRGGAAVNRRGQARRLLHIVRILVVHAIAHLVAGHARLRPLARFVPMARMTGPRRFRQLFEDLGGSFIKFGQMLALQPDIVSLEYCDELFNLLDRIPPFPYEDVERVVVEELGAPPDQLFDAFRSAAAGHRVDRPGARRDAQGPEGRGQGAAAERRRRVRWATSA